MDGLDVTTPLRPAVSPPDALKEEEKDEPSSMDSIDVRVYPIAFSSLLMGVGMRKLHRMQPMLQTETTTRCKSYSV